jgi:type II secretory pathway predicted ATPase ExeA
MYVSHFELSGRPFQQTADARFYFESATHRKAMSYLGYGLAQGEGFIVITGDEGSGKSTLVAQLMATIDPQRLTAVRIDCCDLDGENLLRRTAQAFGIATDDVERRHVLSRIEAYMHHQARAGRRSLLIVDEAQALSLDALEALRQLSNFQLGGQSLVQIFLLGLTEFRNLVRNTPDLEALRQRIIASHHLEPLQAEEIRPYLEHRLKVAGWLGRPAFAPQAVALLAEVSGGVPSQLNIVASKVLECAAMAGTDWIDGMIVSDACGQLGAALSVPDLADDAPAMPQLGADRSAAQAGSEPREADGAGPAPDGADIKSMRAEVHSMRAAIGEAADRPDPVSADRPDLEMLAERLDRVEARLTEQEALLRQILGKLLEWMDREGAGAAVSHRAA